MGNQSFWSDVASFAAIIGVGVVIYAAVVGVRQLKEMTKARNLEAMLRIYELIASKEARAARQFIYSELRSAPDAVIPAEHEKIEEVAVTLDRVGALVGAGLVPKDLLFKSHREMIIRSWDKLAPYVLYRRLERDSTFAIHFEQLADSARGDWEAGSSRVIAEPEMQHDAEAAEAPDLGAPATQP